VTLALKRAAYKFAYLLPYLFIVVYDDTGQPIDSASNGRAPLPWEIHCHPTQMFHDETHLLEVPHTAAIAVTSLLPLHYTKARFPLPELTARVDG